MSPVLEGDVAADQVVDDGLALVRDAQPHARRRPRVAREPSLARSVACDLLAVTSRSRSLWRDTAPRPSRARASASASRICSMFSAVERSRSVSSMRSTKRCRPTPRASSQLYSAVRAPPTCSAPVGEGANLTLMDSAIATAMLIGGHVSTAGGLVNAHERGVERGLRGDPDLQPVAAHVAAHAVQARRHRRVPRADGRRPDQVGRDPRRLPDQLRLERPRDPQQVDRLAGPRAAPGRRDRGGRRGLPPRLAQGEPLEARRSSAWARRSGRRWTSPSAARCCSRTPPARAGRSGARFEELATWWSRGGGDERIGVCLDCCHLLASGFDIRTADGLAQVVDDFDAQLGLDRLGACT